MTKVGATIVFEKTWDAINEMAYDSQGNPIMEEIVLQDGTRTQRHQRRYKYIVEEGSSRSSKTRSLIQIYYRLVNEQLGKRLSVWRDTKKDSRDTVGYDMLLCFQSMPGYNNDYYNKTEAIFSFPTASRIEINGTDDENKVMGYNGHVAWLNEPYNISRSTFDQIDQRTEDFIIIDWNPKMAHWVEDLKKDERTLVIKSTFRDNPFCPPEQKRKILSYQPVSMCQIVTDKLITEQEAKVYNITENPLNLNEKQIKELSRCKENERKGSASQFNWAVYGLGIKAEKPNRIFHWTEIPDDEYNKIDAKKYYATDWGTVDPWGIIEAKYYDGALYLHELNYKSENEWRASLLPTEIEQVEAMDEGLVKWLFTKLNIPKKAVNVCDDNREMKIIALRQAGYDYAIKAAKGPGSILEGVSLLQSIKVFYTSSSKNLEYEQENYEWETDRYGIQSEIPVDRDNHLIDPTRYIATFLKLQGIIKKI